MNEADFIAATEGTIRQTDLQVRNITNGFVVVGIARYVDPVTLQARLAIQSEAVASSATAAATLASDFLTNGKFA